ncbi:MAG: hypothetical protein LCH84_12570 [Gemmatimonadetes bacterium]|nr:hypothetical protein [Gemmatimonadota bacterium]
MLTRTRRLGAAITCAVGLLAGCDAGTPPKNELRLRTEDFTIRVSPETKPTRALEPIYWRVTVHDAKTGTPIQAGQGRIFATNRDMKTVANGLEETGELGTYRSHLMFVTAGMWAMAIQFRRDSLQPLQKTQDWTQDILSADEPGDFSVPQSSRPAVSPGAAPTVAPPDSGKRKTP